jgi:asparagine synthase (glutamine-hydrolysing)
VFVFSLATASHQGQSSLELTRSLMNAYPRRAPDGEVVVSAPSAAASVATWAVVSRDRHAVPTWDEARGLLFAGDVRLYNRPELIRDLGAMVAPLDDCSDLELARQAYLRWGDEAPAHLVGDFAFAAWDERQRRLFAARDHFGVRPLCYLPLPDGLAIASDVRQLLILLERSIDEVDDRAVLGWLMGRRNDLRGTFFRRISRVAPGHSVVFEKGGVRETRFWAFPRMPDAPRPYEENCEELRTIFRRAVRDRLESDRPIVAHSSGGFDSSTIIMAAEEVYRTDAARPPVVLASAIAPGFPSDESHYMDAVAARVSFEGVRWNAIWDDGMPFPGVSRAAPKLLRGPAGGPRKDLDVARERGARVLLSGVLGDGLWHAAGVRRDMVRHGRIVAVGRDLSRQGLGFGLLRSVVDAGLGILPPVLASRVGSRLLSARSEPPEWLGPRLRAIFSPREEQPVNRGAWSSHVQYAAWARLSGPDTSHGVDSFVDYAAEDGIELRAPFADVRLAESLLRIPWQQREPLGHLRRTGRDALGPLLPEEFSSRVGQQPWTAVWMENLRRAAVVLAPLFRERRYLSAPFVDRGIARAMLDDVLARGENAGLRAHILVSELGTLEAWLRDLFG